MDEQLLDDSGRNDASKKEMNDVRLLFFKNLETGKKSLIGTE